MDGRCSLWDQFSPIVYVQPSLRHQDHCWHQSNISREANLSLILGGETSNRQYDKIQQGATTVPVQYCSAIFALHATHLFSVFFRPKTFFFVRKPSSQSRSYFSVSFEFFSGLKDFQLQTIPVMTTERRFCSNIYLCRSLKHIGSLKSDSTTKDEQWLGILAVSEPSEETKKVSPAPTSADQRQLKKK